MQELENATTEAGTHLQEKEKRIAILEREMKIRASKSELVRLQATLEEKETHLRSALEEKQNLQVCANKAIICEEGARFNRRTRKGPHLKP